MKYAKEKPNKIWICRFASCLNAVICYETRNIFSKIFRLIFFNYFMWNRHFMQKIFGLFVGFAVFC
jgi:hypothetical protein